MFKPLLLSGWFRVQPYFKYVVFFILITPLLSLTVHSTLAKQAQVGKTNSESGQSGAKSQVGDTAKTAEIDATKINTLAARLDSLLINKERFGGLQVLPTDKINSGVIKENNQSSNDGAEADVVAVVKLSPTGQLSADQVSLIQRLKDAKVQSLLGDVSLADGALATVKTNPSITNPQPSPSEIQVEGQPKDTEMVQNDPLGSPHPIPWKWIMATQEAISNKQGSGVRYYRSIPVISPDGKYAVYSRVQLDVKPEMYNSRVTSILFVQDVQSKRLRVMATTSPAKDPLLKRAGNSEGVTDTDGKIGVLVPVSWSEKGDRFLARKFEGIFNTADSTDSAVIWDRQNHRAVTVAPTEEQHEHEKIAILLGWSQKQPDSVLFKAGELGEEDWPLVQVSSNGKIVTLSSDEDKPVTFGEKITQVWAEPQVASR
jgi:hypothetical protein